MGKRSKQEELIVEMLKSRRRIDISDICDGLGVSEATARRYLSSLEDNGTVIRTHGGAVLRDVARTYSYSNEASQMQEEKRRIAATAAALVQDGEHLFMDTGTTLNEFGNALYLRLAEGTLKGVSIVTNSLTYNESLAEYCAVTLTGGRIRHNRRDLSGTIALWTLANYRFDRAVLGVDSIDEDGTLYTTDDDTAAMARQAIANSTQVIILADSSKLRRTSYVAYAKLLPNKMELITDSRAPESFLRHIKGLGIQVITAEAINNH